MKHLPIAAFAISFALTAVPGAAATLGTITGDGFTLAMPGTPTKSASEVDTPGGKVLTQEWMAKDQGVVYAVTTADYPVALVKRVKASVFVSNARDAVAERLNGRITSEAPVLLGANLGLAFTITSDIGELKGRSYMIGQRGYTLMVLHRSGDDAPQADAYLSSLRITQ
ncbi:hypothetical protein ACFQPG_12275 [Sphingomonas sp. GCM10030256]|uniref:hypothetical protein n=1 Tax=Sphingomonas sp. GCM10030256 TaxID=3273427 RepID=UPI0036181EB1